MKSGFKKFWYTATPGADTESDIACEICLDHELECIEAGDESKYGEIFDWMDLESTDELRYTEPWEICCCMCGELVEPEPGYGEEYDE